MLDRIVIAVVATLATTFGFVSGKSEGSKNDQVSRSLQTQPGPVARPHVAPPPPSPSRWVERLIIPIMIERWCQESVRPRSPRTGRSTLCS